MRSKDEENRKAANIAKTKKPGRNVTQQNNITEDTTERRKTNKAEVVTGAADHQARKHHIQSNEDF